MRHDAHARGRLASFRSRRALFVALMLSVAPIAGVLIDAERAAGAAPKWSISPSPNYSGAEANALSGVSCVNANNCFAVGYHGTPSATKVLIEHWNGNKWSTMASPNKPSSLNLLLGVSCANANRCIAVGYFSGAGGRYKPLVEGWNGTKWSIMTVPSPAGSTFTALNGVSCPSANSCFAVGSFSKDNTGLPAKTLVEHWNGRTWSIMTAPNPAGTSAAYLGGVSCPTRTNCFAVGSAQITGAERTLVEYWNGSTWKIQANPNPGAGDTAFIGVSCSSPKHCFAVGRQSGVGNQRPLIERWNGNKWAIVSSPKPSDETTAFLRTRTLSGVTCSSATNCFAVGGYSGNSAMRTLVEHWNGNKWTIQASPNPSPSKNAYLAGVSCASATKCFAVGSSLGTLIERYA